MNVLAAVANLPEDLWQALLLSFQLAAVTTVVLLVLGLPIAYWLAFTRSRLSTMVEGIVGVPLVLPPTVIGFYVLIFLAPQHALGKVWENVFGSSLPFSFAGLVVGSVIYSLPFAVQPFQAAIRGVARDLLEASASLGASLRQTFIRIIIPAARRGIAAGAVLSFAHTIGEFGVVLMIGGAIPGETKVASIALYDEAQKLHYDVAHAYAFVLLALSFAMLFLLAWLQKRSDPPGPSW